jgi:uncharacterized protein YhbP (UPF0306 family)
MLPIEVERIVREYLDKSLHMSFATVSEGRPWVSEVHFVYDDNLNIYWRSLGSRRHSQELSANPYVAGNVVKQHSLQEYPHAIYFEGTAKLLSDMDEQKLIFGLFQQRLAAGEGIIDEAAREDGHKFYKITVENWYAFGKFGGETGLKHRLVWNGGII